MNPWHDVNVGQEAPHVVNTIIEIPKDTRAEYELDKKSGLLKMNRVLFSSMYYPANSGFIPKTWSNNVPLGILVLSQIDVIPLCIVEARVIGVIRMREGEQQQERILAVATGDLSVAHIEEVDDLPPHFTSELKTFFEDYRKSESNSVVVEAIQHKEAAEEIISKAIEDYRLRFI